MLAMRLEEPGGRLMLRELPDPEPSAEIVSVANLTRQDATDFLRLAPRIGVKTHTRIYPLSDANEALHALRRGAIEGAAVVTPLA
jgi:D-arabinose 1-dehydrogenase-like Zn-dependent alcohol dehydrogenase